jgi:hypothetical protein
LQLHPGQVQRRQRGGAGRVHDAVGAAQVKTVGNTAGDDVAEETGEGMGEGSMGVQNTFSAR